MPKKFKGENSKAVEARARKNAQKTEEADRKQKEAEDEFWRDDDKQLQRKQQRKDDKEKHRIEQLERKELSKKLLEEELTAMTPKPSVAKLTRVEIEAYRARMAKEEAAQGPTEVMHDEKPLEENINRLETENEARCVEAAISVLSVQEPSLEKHPEKRVKAAYSAYEERRLPELKTENPNLRLSQLKQMLKKDWMKSPENPLNQANRAYNIK